MNNQHNIGSTCAENGTTRPLVAQINGATAPVTRARYKVLAMVEWLTVRNRKPFLAQISGAKAPVTRARGSWLVKPFLAQINGAKAPVTRARHKLTTNTTGTPTSNQINQLC